MTKKFKPAILLLINLVILQGICGQTTQDMPGYLVQKFSHYCKSVPREEIFIHSDRDEYVSGEDLWFNVYLIDRQSFKPSLSSRIVYFEILNSENNPVVQKRIQINNGFGPGQIVLPDTLSSGSYTIRAYTSWMKNFLPYNCFMKAITIYNTLNNKPFKRKLRTGIFVKDVNSKNPAWKINKAGITFNTNNSNPDILEVLVIADNKYRSENKNLIFIFIQTHGNINYLSSEKVYEEETKFYIPKSMLSAGINQITLFNLKGEPDGERYIYTPDKENNFINLHSADSCDLRDKITLGIEFNKESLKALNSVNLSVSVAPESNTMGIMDIDDYLVFGTEYGQFWQDAAKGRKSGNFPAKEWIVFF